NVPALLQQDFEKVKKLSIEDVLSEQILEIVHCHRVHAVDLYHLYGFRLLEHRERLRFASGELYSVAVIVLRALLRLLGADNAHLCAERMLDVHDFWAIGKILQMICVLTSLPIVHVAKATRNSHPPDWQAIVISSHNDVNALV